MNVEPLTSVPRHVAIIMDGNGRWAKREKKAAIAGHQKGVETVKGVVKKALELGIPYLTLFAFSSENWARPAQWVEQLMQLLRSSLAKSAEDFLKDDVRLRIIGDRERLPPDIRSLINDLEKKTSTNSKMVLVIALSYGGRADIVQAVQGIAQDVVLGRIEPQAIDQATIEKYLYTSGIPDPDLLIRTSGEYRMSNFLLWQLAYSELIFVDCLWPDFTENDFMKALHEYGTRERRFGICSDQTDE